MRRAMLSLTAATAALLLSGCADPDATVPGGAGASTAPPASATSPPTVMPPRPSPPPTKPGRPGDAARPITVDGVAEAGVEPGCKVLTAGGAAYLLIGGDVPLGVPVRVTGVLQPGVLTTCQQGTPIRVTTVQRR